MKKGIVSPELRKFVLNDYVATKIFAYFSTRQRGQPETIANKISDQIESEYSEVISTFKSLTDLEVGSFIVGRKGSPSRFKWYYNVVELAKELSTDPDVAQEFKGVLGIEDREPETDSDSSSIEHEFVLRADFKVNLRLPLDLSSGEADRLAGWVKSLPFDGD